ncbi:hypothetical protein K474DRAFT_1669830 [Panus rudis PR-1116 ss-1]|nr:hypothetical protein K474DRAFT_1669830 [Panus rudis PR-1116 ss-1]
MRVSQAKPSIRKSEPESKVLLASKPGLTKAVGNSGRKKNSLGYRALDERALVKIVRRFLPLTIHDWNLVEEEYNLHASGQGRSGMRDAASLKRKLTNSGL